MIVELYQITGLELSGPHPLSVLAITRYPFNAGDWMVSGQAQAVTLFRL
jgi:hypothetical protein